MKVTLVVASGVHKGKPIPIPGPQFLIGRDPECQLRPASQAVSKRHCLLVVRSGRVFVKDFGSTNGTFLNNEPITPEAVREVKAGDRLQVGPLDFTVQIVASGPPDQTPLPDVLRAVEAVAARVDPAAVAAPAATDSGPGTKPVSGTRPEAPAPAKPQPIPPARSADEEHDAAAAMLLGMSEDDGEEPKVPPGSTIMEMTSVNPPAGGEGKPDEAKGEKKSSVPSREDTSSAASEILRRYMRRPR